MREIWQFLLVILAGIVFGCALVYWMVRDDAVDKNMAVYQVLLSPETIENLSNQAIKGGKDRAPEYLIESIKFATLDESTKKWVEKRIDIGPYEAFYQKIAQDKGVIDPAESVLQSFDTSSSSKLSIYMKHFSAMVHEGTVELFQMVQFNQEGNSYRINMHVDTDALQWIYFNHSGVEKMAKETLIEL